MKRCLILLAALALAAPMARAAGGLGVFGSYWDMEDFDDPAVGGGLKLKLGLAAPFCLELRASYLQGFAEEPCEDANIVPLEAGLVADFPVIPDAVTVYAGGGGGYYIMPEFELSASLGPLGKPDIDPEDTFGYFAVAGIELRLNAQVALFAEAKYTWLEIDEIKVNGEEPDIDEIEETELTGFGANAGLLFKW